MKEASRLHPVSKKEKARLKNTFDLPLEVHRAEYNKVKLPPEPAHKFEVSLEPASFTDEKYDLFFDYQQNVHKEAPHQISRSGFKNFLCNSPLKQETRTVDGKEQLLGSYHQCYRLDGRLVAMGVLDLLPHCVSGVYMLYHSDVEQWQFGKLSALQEAALTLEGGYKYYYMGFYIHSCTKMKYKGGYKTQYVLDPESYEWNPLDDKLRGLLTAKGYVSMSREKRRQDAKEFAEESAKEPQNQEDSEETDLSEFPHRAAKEAGDAVANGMSLFDLKVPGLMTPEDIEEQLDLGTMPIKIGSRMAEAQDLVSWETSDIRDSHSIKGIMGELVACIGPEAAWQVVVSLG